VYQGWLQHLPVHSFSGTGKSALLQDGRNSLKCKPCASDVPETTLANKAVFLNPFPVNLHVFQLILPHSVSEIKKKFTSSFHVHVATIVMLFISSEDKFVRKNSCAVKNQKI
jgi:hypothetical protein